MPDPKNLPTYSNEEVASILTRALDRSHEGGRISHDELLETAREIGMSTLEIEAAVTEEVRQRAERLVAEEQQKRRVRLFLRHASACAVTVAVLFAVDAKTLGGVFWYWIALGWGAALAVHAALTFRPREELAPAPAPVKNRVEVRGADDASGPQRKAG